VQTLLLKVMGHQKLLETNDDVMLQQKLQLRAPYITPLNILQVCFFDPPKIPLIAIIMT